MTRPEGEVNSKYPCTNVIKWHALRCPHKIRYPPVSSIQNVTAPPVKQDVWWTIVSHFSKLPQLHIVLLRGAAKLVEAVENGLQVIQYAHEPSLTSANRTIAFIPPDLPPSACSPPSSQEARQRRGTHLTHFRGAHGRRDPMRKATLRAPQCAVDLGRHGAPQGQMEAKPFVGGGFGTANRTKWQNTPFSAQGLPTHLRKVISLWPQQTR